MSPSWSNFRHPFTSASSSSSVPPEVSSSSSRERRESAGYDSNDLLPLPPALNEDRRDSGRFSDAMEDDSSERDQVEALPSTSAPDTDTDHGSETTVGVGDAGSGWRAREDVRQFDPHEEQRSTPGSSRRYLQGGQPALPSDLEPNDPYEPFNNYPAASSAHRSPYTSPPQRHSSAVPSHQGLSPSRSFPLPYEQYDAPSQDHISSPRDRLPSSTSYSSMSASLRGRRAPAPAALDLSPRSERVRREAAGLQGQQRYQELGLGAAPVIEGLDRRIVTEPPIRVSAMCHVKRVISLKL